MLLYIDHWNRVWDSCERYLQGRWRYCRDVTAEPGEVREGPRRRLPVSWLGEKSYTSSLFDTVISLWPTKVLLISCSVGQPRVPGASESKSVRKQPKKETVGSIVLKWLLTQKPGTVVQSQRWKITIGACEGHCSFSKGPGHAGVV